MRGSVEDGLRRRRGLDGGGDVSNVVREEKERGDRDAPRAAPRRSPYLVPRRWRRGGASGGRGGVGRSC